MNIGARYAAFNEREEAELKRMLERLDEGKAEEDEIQPEQESQPCAQLKKN